MSDEEDNDEGFDDSTSLVNSQEEWILINATNL